MPIHFYNFKLVCIQIDNTVQKKKNCHVFFYLHLHKYNETKTNSKKIKNYYYKYFILGY